MELEPAVFAGPIREVCVGLSARRSVPFFDGSLERCRGRRAYCSPFGPPAHDSHRLRPWLQAVRRVPEGLPAGYSGGEIAPEGRDLTANRRRRRSPAGPVTRAIRTRPGSQTPRDVPAQPRHATACPRRSGWILRRFARTRPYLRKSSCRSCDGSLRQLRRPS